ncbi:DgyrCDS1688 [Dimorphilus gyrociliatus]|uniref:DgyrCDS1688 n=1 Tax=Dimorphilus gyrociliatus TaxID=2664684 RepID=A0A7I8V7Y5_9ANNE|nr:DgyrCDS1688 [Dimorphilus gyrociliatus]
MNRVANLLNSLEKVSEERISNIEKTENLSQPKNVNYNNLHFPLTKKPMFIGICGRVGSGKVVTTLLLNLLNELPHSFTRLSSRLKFSYSPQEPWLTNASIKENILFHEKFDAERYKSVLFACCLDKDLIDLPNGDKTLVGENGKRLSGGQRARISLARAVYRKATFYVFDDPLSAINEKVTKLIIQRCFLDFLKNKVIFLTTHQVHLLNEAHIIYEVIDGCCHIISKSDYNLGKELTENIQHLKIYQNEIFHEEEEMNSGFAGFKVYFNYFKTGSFLLLTMSLLLFGIFFSIYIWIDKVLTQFAVENLNYSMLMTVAIILITLTIIEIGRLSTYYINIILCSVNLHKKMFQKILEIPFGFFHKNPKGRILNRFSRDLGFVDSLLVTLLEQITLWVGAIVFSVALAVYNIPLLFLPLSIFVISMLLLYRKLTPIGSEFKRLEAKQRTPIYEHIDNVIQGLIVIRCFQKQKTFLKKFYTASNNHTTIAIIQETYSKFLQQVYFAVTLLFYMCIAIACLKFSSYLNPTIADFDNTMTSVERIQYYSSLKSEEDPDKKFPPVSDSWPSNGSLTIKNVFMRYDESLPYSLKNINVNILSGEKIGVVGRTGAGKSSLISALFRMCPVEGEIILDGVNILTDVNLQCSRSVISVIPQDPILFTGTYRSNLDPLDEYCDDDIWMSLKKVYLDKKVGNTAQQLNSTISECGRNLSVGERQLICLARALLKKCHLLIIDEATANVDNETDKCIQNILKCHFKDCTTITIAHRLSTIMDSDKIIVMDSGEVGEYGTVKELLRKEGMFFELVNSQANVT